MRARHEPLLPRYAWAPGIRMPKARLTGPARGDLVPFQRDAPKQRGLPERKSRDGPREHGRREELERP
jgi:hypothetical protein